jgi:hypothetical protein
VSYDTFPMAEVAVPPQMFHDILSLIARLRAPPAPDDRETVTHCDRRRQQSCALINGRAVGFSAARGQSGDLDVSDSAAIEFL